jgi:hypothetical protein
MPFNFNRKKFAYGAAPLLTRDMLRASASLDFPSVAAAGTADLTITVPGAQVGDDVMLCHDVAPPNLMTHVAWVSAADTVTVRARNGTAGSIDQAATTYRVIVFKAY